MNDHEEPDGPEPVPAGHAADDPAIDDPAFDDPAFDDPAFDDLRSLLADARVTEPVPVEVAARLDATLASLRSGRATVVPLRRRLAPRLLAAAAALVVVGAGGVGITQVTDGSGTSDSAGTAEKSVAGRDDSVPSPDASDRSPQLSGGLAAPPPLTRASFARDASRLMRTLSANGSADGSAGAESETSGAVPAAPPVTSPERASAEVDGARAACPGPSVPRAVTMPATLDGSPVALVFRTPTASAQRVEAWSCDGSTLLASASVPH